MSTRQQRINSQEEIRRKAASFNGQQINIVSENRTAVTGTVVSVDEYGIQLRNMRLKKVLIPFAQITEIYYDTKE